MSLLRPTINLGNSIVGVSILTMPWCFSQCGVILGALLLFASALFTTWTCKMLLRAANIKRQPTYETLGRSVSGSLGKLGVELGNIGLGVGTCVGFFVIIGDLLPPLVSGVLGLDWVDPQVLRAVLLVLSAVFVAFPLTLIRNVDRLSVISVGSLGFYMFLIGQLVISSKSQLMDWSSVTLWQFSGVFKCLPIFSLAFCCQSQMFVIYATLKESNARRMGSVVDGAVWMVMSAYLAVAVFGYMSYHTSGDIHGDILANFPTNSISQLTRFGFAVTVMLSFPLIVFPCRVSINSLLCAEGSMELRVTPPIPQSRFIAITAGVMFFTLSIAILIPNIQVVLALVGSTLGSLICFILPGIFFTSAAGSNTDYSFRAKFSVVLGLCVLVLSTMVTLNSWSNETETHYHIKPPPHVEQPTTPTAPPTLTTLMAIDNIKLPNEEGQLKISPSVSVNEVQSPKPAEPAAAEEIHEKLVEGISQLAERVEKLEEENKDLKDWKDKEEKHALADERLKAAVKGIEEKPVEQKELPLDHNDYPLEETPVKEKQPKESVKELNSEKKNLNLGERDLNLGERDPNLHKRDLDSDEIDLNLEKKVVVKSISPESNVIRDDLPNDLSNDLPDVVGAKNMPLKSEENAHNKAAARDLKST